MSQAMKEAVFRWITEKVASEDSGDTIVVVGRPRSGTTWLAETLAALQGYKYLNEPLHLNANDEAREAGFSWKTYTSPGEDVEWAEEYIFKALTGRVGSHWTWRFESSTRLGKLYEHLTCRKHLVKFCRAHQLLHWMVERFPLREVIFLIRHPCAVVNSTMKHGAWDNIEPTEPELSRVPEPLAREIRSRMPPVDTQAKAIAAMWCVDHFIPFKVFDGNPWILLTYEEMVLGGVRKMKKISKNIGIDFNKKMSKKIGDASSSASKDLRMNKKDQISKWKRQMDSSKIEEILKFVRKFDLEIYDEGIMPNKNAI